MSQLMQQMLDRSNSAMFDGTTALRAKQPTHVPTLLEQMGVHPLMTAEKYCQALSDYRQGFYPGHYNLFGTFLDQYFKRSLGIIK